MVYRPSPVPQSLNKEDLSSFRLYTEQELQRIAIALEEVESEAEDAAAAFAALAVDPTVGGRQFRILTANVVGLDSTAAQNLLGATDPSITLAADSTYHFNGMFGVTRAAGTTAHTFQIQYGVTNALASIFWSAVTKNAAGETLAAASARLRTSATAAAVTASNSDATENIFVRLEGILRTTLSTVLTPQYVYSAAPGGVPTILANSFFSIQKLGTAALSKSSGWA